MSAMPTTEAKRGATFSYALCLCWSIHRVSGGSTPRIPCFIRANECIHFIRIHTCCDRISVYGRVGMGLV